MNNGRKPSPNPLHRWSRALIFKTSRTHRIALPLVLVGSLLAGAHSLARAVDLPSNLPIAPRATQSASSTPSASSIQSVSSAQPQPETASAPSGKRYALHLHHLHTGESLDVVYRIGDTYLPAAVAQLNHFLRDHRTQDTADYDVHEFDLLHSIAARLNRPNAVIDIVCGYRTPWSNNFLRTRYATTGVAEHSQHMLSKAIDIRIPGVNTLTLRNTALALGMGGVGYYPTSQFVHVDVGPVRQWQYGGTSVAGNTAHHHRAHRG